ncbi:hypothetical protein BDV28DRAFT_156432 [Aspergillus coremiiformis]|uniref:Peptidase C45 hydrolase domain-containing protein n=1 Tax=Aspergillus coremiiformis TaxID=138285 RepID=A0A5N6Z8Y8_9EURO|nr:hypothetical protein BDV28DRAFT_156432 [Aspergillus coremiiformis]
MSWPTVLQPAEEFRASRDHKTPDLCVEMQGIARVSTQNWVLMEIELSGKPRIYLVTEGGIVGKIGCNNAGVPIHVPLCLCLESTSVAGALQTVSSLGVASSQHILIADSTTSLSLELSPLGDMHLKEDECGIVTHTNHSIENKDSGLADNSIKEDPIMPTLLRQQIFSDTYNAPQSICSQGDSSAIEQCIRSPKRFL